MHAFGSEANASSAGGGGGISGGSLSKTGTGMVTLTTANSFSGATTIDGGTLVLDFTTATPLTGTSEIAITAPGTVRAVHDDGDFTLDRKRLRGVFDTILTEGGEVLSENVSKAFLEAYEIPVTRPQLARNADEAVARAVRSGWVSSAGATASLSPGRSQGS